MNLTLAEAAIGAGAVLEAPAQRGQRRRAGGQRLLHRLAHRCARRAVLRRARRAARRPRLCRRRAGSAAPWPPWFRARAWLRCPMPRSSRPLLIAEDPLARPAGAGRARAPPVGPARGRHHRLGRQDHHQGSRRRGAGRKIQRAQVAGQSEQRLRPAAATAAP